MKAGCRIASRRGKLFILLSVLVGAVVTPVTPVAAQDPAIYGRWNQVFVNWGVKSVHAISLPTRKILVWYSDESTKLWDPAYPQYPPVFTPNTTQGHNVFCSGHAALASDRFLI